MIDFPAVDTHLHFWDLDRFRYPWLDDIPRLNRSFFPDDYKQAVNGLEIEKMVYVQCECLPSQYKEEVEWVTDIACGEARIQGIVSWAPLEKGEAVRPEIEKLKENPLVKGIRRIIQFEPDLEFCLQPDFIRGVNMLKDYGLTFDICISQKHNKSVIRFLDQCEDVPMILDHIGKPDIKNHRLDPWRNEIREISEFPNVYCKLSSLATEADHENWTTDDLRPFVEHIIKCFGIDRLVFASDWPVSSLAADIPTCVSTMLEFLKGCSREELQKVFHDNAEKFYGV